MTSLSLSLVSYSTTVNINVCVNSTLTVYKKLNCWNVSCSEWLDMWHNKFRLIYYVYFSMLLWLWHIYIVNIIISTSSPKQERLYNCRSIFIVYIVGNLQYETMFDNLPYMFIKSYVMKCIHIYNSGVNKRLILKKQRHCEHTTFHRR